MGDCVGLLDVRDRHILRGDCRRHFECGREMWVRVNFDEPVELPQELWIALNFNAQQAKGVYASYDTSTKGEHSHVGLPGSDTPPEPTQFGGDWMVQVLLAPPK